LTPLQWHHARTVTDQSGIMHLSAHFRRNGQVMQVKCQPQNVSFQTVSSNRHHCVPGDLQLVVNIMKR
jgi:hypothetical protein